MAGGKSTPKKDKKIKVSGGQLVKTGELLCRGVDSYKAGINVKGTGTLYALCPGTIRFSKKKSPRGSVKTYINIVPA
ncbi:MAG: 50S ribosomal protein L27 [Candidatus Omnitrophica bacterium]|nr:50S ribosomal protein L27 [Candidatus Omnitrophota bacterium]MDD5775766.1 50S ribosomal protein L27 [Candidatus Omnitrophota bacterium]